MKNFHLLTLTLLLLTSGLVSTSAFCMDLSLKEQKKSLHLRITYSNYFDLPWNREKMEDFYFKLILKTNNGYEDRYIDVDYITMSSNNTTATKETDVSFPQDVQTVRFFAQLLNPRQVEWMEYPDSGVMQEFIYYGKHQNPLKPGLSVSTFHSGGHVNLEIYGETSVRAPFIFGDKNLVSLRIFCPFYDVSFEKIPNDEKSNKTLHTVNEKDKDAINNQLATVYHYHLGRGVPQLRQLTEDQVQKILEQAVSLVLNGTYSNPDTDPLIKAWEIIMGRKWS